MAQGPEFSSSSTTVFENGTCSHSLGRNRTPIEKKKKWMNFQRKKSYGFNK